MNKDDRSEAACKSLAWTNKQACLLNGTNAEFKQLDLREDAAVEKLTGDTKSTCLACPHGTKLQTPVAHSCSYGQ